MAFHLSVSEDVRSPAVSLLHTGWFSWGLELALLYKIQMGKGLLDKREKIWSWETSSGHPTITFALGHYMWSQGWFHFTYNFYFQNVKNNLLRTVRMVL